MTRRHLTSWTVSALIMAMLLSACTTQPSTSSSSGGTQPSGGSTATQTPAPAPAPAPKAPAIEELVIAQGSDTFVMDPDGYQGGDATNMYRHIFDTLVHNDRSGKIIPWVASSWKYENDTTIIFTLRKDIKYHDGVQLTAKDAVFSYERMLDPNRKSLDKPRFQPWVAKMEALDDFTLKITTKMPYAPALERLSAFYILPKHDLQKRGDKEFGLKPIGSGPYRVVRWEKDQFLALDAVNDHWMSKPPFPKLKFVPIPEGFTATTALLSGDVHISRPLPVAMIEQVSASKSARVEKAPSSRIMFIQFPHVKTRPPNTEFIDNKLVRQALNYALDKDALAQKVAKGNVQVVPGPWSTGHWAYPANAWDLGYKYNPQKAKELLAQAGYPNGFTLTLGAPVGRYLADKELMEATIPYFEAIGVKVNFISLEWSSYGPTRDKGAFAAYYLGLSEGAGDPHGITFYFTKQGRSRGFYGTDPELDKLVAQGVEMVDEAKRQQFYQKTLYPKIMDTAPWIFLWNQVDLYGVSNRLEWTPRSDELIDVREIKVKN